MSCTTSVSPRAFSPFCKFAAMLAPIVPRPMNPACMERSFLRVGLEHFARDVRCRHRRWPTGIEGKMRDHLGQFLFGHAVDERALQMAAQLLGAICGDQRGTDDEAAVALG